MDKLKQYLQENREALDVNQPGDGVWDNIKKAETVQPEGKVVTLPPRRNRLWQYAAAASIAIALFAGWKFMMTPTGTESIAIASAPEPQFTPKMQNTTRIADVPATENNTGVHAVKATVVDPYEIMGSYSNSYRQLVNLQLKNIRRMPVMAEDPAYFDDFRAALSQMDRDEKGIRTIIRKQGISEDLIEQLIGLYQQKLDVLKALQSEINKLNNRSREGRAGNDSLGGYYLNI